MKEISLQDIIDATGGEVHVDDTNIKIGQITTDSREVERNSLFVPRKGEFLDGHEFISDFLRKVE